jgi:hypothetical protein
MNILSLSMLNRNGLGKSSDLIEWEFKLKFVWERLKSDLLELETSKANVK